MCESSGVSGTPRPNDLDANSLKSLERLFALLSSSFLSYAVRAASAEISDARDRRAFAFLEEWLRREEELLEEIAVLIEEAGGEPSRGRIPLEYARFHHVSAAYLLPQVALVAERLIEGLRAAAHSGSVREVRKAYARAISLEEEYLRRARETMSSLGLHTDR